MSDELLQKTAAAYSRSLDAVAAAIPGCDRDLAAKIVARIAQHGFMLWEMEETEQMERQLELATIVVKKAAGLIRTANPSEVGKREVVPQWWHGMKDAIEAFESGQP